MLDDTTAHWPIPNDMREELGRLMGTYAAQPLPVFKDNNYVPPPAVNAALKGSLVEVHFSLKHYRIRKRDSKPLDSFTGLIEQIIILKPGEQRLLTSYKRKNILDGPYRPKPFKTSAPLLVPVATTRTTNPDGLISTPLPSDEQQVVATIAAAPVDLRLTEAASEPATTFVQPALAVPGPSTSPVNKVHTQLGSIQPQPPSTSDAMALPSLVATPTRRTPGKPGGTTVATKASTAGKRRA